MKLPRKAVIEQLLTYCTWIEQDGTYHGGKKHFDSRHKEAVEWLNYI